MNAILSLGRWIFPLPFLAFGLMHFTNTQVMADYVVPAYMPAKSIFVYLSGAGLIGAAVSMYIGKYDKLATTLLSLMLIAVALMVHLPGVMAGGDGGPAATGSFLKDLGLAAACMLYAQNLAKDNSVIG
ncbi:MAG: DoxX family membrane protein [Saprospiraceae bacterium]